MKQPIKIALVDDESLFLEGLILLLSGTENLNVVTRANEGHHFLRNLEALPEAEFPDIILVDLQMEPLNGFQLVEIVKKSYPDLKIIILSSHYKQAMFGHMIKMGVSAFLPKNASRELLLEALESVYTSGVFLTQKDHQMLVDYMKNKPKIQRFGEPEELSDREKEVLRLICLELTSQEIADQLYLSKRTVESHRQNILEKTGARNTVGLVVYAIANDIYTPPALF